MFYRTMRIEAGVHLALVAYLDRLRVAVRENPSAFPTYLQEARPISQSDAVRFLIEQRARKAARSKASRAGATSEAPTDDES